MYGACSNTDVSSLCAPGISAQIGHNGLRLPQTDALQASGNGLDYSPAHVLIWVTRRTAAQFMQRTNTVFVDF